MRVANSKPSDAGFYDSLHVRLWRSPKKNYV